MNIHSNSANSTAAKLTVREQIMKVSKGVFEKYGFRKTTIDDLAKALRKGKSSIYYYFESKEDLFKAILDHEVEQLKKEIMAAVEQPTSPLEKIRIYIEVRIEAIKKLSVLYDFQKDNYFTIDNADELRNKYDGIEVDIIKEILDNGIVSGDFNIRNTRITAISILTIIKGMELPVLTEELSAIKEKIDDMLPILFYGICKTKS